MVQGTDGNLYGRTGGGGVKGGGTIFKMTPSGQLTIIYNFCAQPKCADGSGPNPMILGTDGNFYGTTWAGGGVGGLDGRGCTVFKITPAGMLTTLYSFCSQPDCSDGFAPAAPLMQGADGNFYGTTTGYGDETNDKGTIFQITPDGKLTTFYRFCSQTNCLYSYGMFAGVAQGADGDFYGTDRGGGKNQCGDVFKVSVTGSLTTLYSFCSQPDFVDGFAPESGVIQGIDGNSYGTTLSGGIYDYGTVFSMTPDGVLTSLYSFCSVYRCKDGISPYYGLIQASDSNFYGTTQSAIFSITSAGAFTTLYKSGYPNGALVQATNGLFYGATFKYGGKRGTIYSLAVGLSSFVETVQPSGHAGQTIMILGQDFTGTTDVSFNGTAASFSVMSDTFLKAIVPGGATSGSIAAATPGGTLISNKPFAVR
jgi:uncharacterized repeat protein (TIGR03803 family)